MNRTLRALLAALAALVLVVALAACGGEDEESSGSESAATGGAPAVEPIEESSENADTSITIGSKNFTEQFILGEIYSQALEAAGYDVTKELNLGSEQIAFRALKSGQVDAYPEYTGTAITSFFGVKIEDAAGLTPEEAYEMAKEDYAKEGIVALPQGKFDNTYVVASTVEEQEELGATTISDLAALPNADEIKIAGFPECRQRADCLLGLENVYNWTPTFVANEGKFEPLDEGQTELGFVFGTDGELSLNDYATYEDDKSLFPPYYISLGIREEALEAIGPEGEEVLTRVQEPLTEDVMRELNARVDLDKEEPEQVAADYLSESGFVQ
jgi:glycine betaine/choline ABC-type transport system substrate-binding protein